MCLRLIFICICLPLGLFAQAKYSFSKDTLLMGSAFAFTAIHESQSKAQAAVEVAIAEVDRIERLISSWKPTSQTSSVNQFAGIRAVKVDWELFQLIERSQKIAQLSNGYFDISFASIDKLWQFNGDTVEMPSDEELSASVALIDFQKIILNRSDTTVYLENEGMKIGFGAIGKGYAADRAKVVMLENGVTSGVVNAGGDVLAWGYKADGRSWNVGVANPTAKDEVLLALPIVNQAIVTSGEYEKYVIVDGERYGHIINPKTGIPSKGILSVSILTSTAELADALATTVFVLGEKDGLALINHLEGVEGIIINQENKVLYSSKLKDWFADE